MKRKELFIIKMDMNKFQEIILHMVMSEAAMVPVVSKLLMTDLVYKVNQLKLNHGFDQNW